MLSSIRSVTGSLKPLSPGGRQSFILRTLPQCFWHDLCLTYRWLVNTGFSPGRARGEEEILIVGKGENSMVEQAKRMLQYFLLILVVLVILFDGNRSAFGLVYLSEDWDTGTPSAYWPCKLAPSGRCDSNLEFRGWWSPLGSDCRYTYEANTGISTTKAYSGTRSFYNFRAAGYSDSCDIVYNLPAPYPTKIYIRFYLYLDSNFINFNTPVSREPSYHLLFTNTAHSMTGLRVNLLAGVPWTSPWQCGHSRGGVPSTQPFAFFSVQDYDREWPVGTYPAGCYNLLQHLNEWLCVEFMMDANTNTVQMWVNETLVYQATDRITQTNFTRIIFSNYMSSEGGSGFDTGYYIDNIVVSDSYIGPVAPDGRPKAPVNVKGNEVESD
jgi:hypothetical protein